MNEREKLIKKWINKLEEGYDYFKTELQKLRKKGADTKILDIKLEKIRADIKIAKEFEDPKKIIQLKNRLQDIEFEIKRLNYYNQEHKLKKSVKDGLVQKEKRHSSS